MTTITLRTIKGTPLTHVEMDDNFNNLNTDKLEAATTATLTNKSISLAANTITGTVAEFNAALSDGNFATQAGIETLTNKSIDLTDNTLSGTTAEFNAALSDGSFATLDGSETLTNKTLTNPTINDASLTGNVTAPTQSPSDNSTKVATTAYVDTATAAVPAGAVMAFAMNSAPTNWLACDGAAVSRTTYATLFTAISTVYGTGDGITTFNLPDLRGYFVRGAGTNGDGTASGTFGAKQADDFESHTHSQYTNSGAGSGPIVGGGAFGALNATTGATGGTETRPANIAMLYCIKY